jgi:predicted dehydrogenase
VTDRPYPTPEFAPDPVYKPELPQHPRPIVILGAGGIVHDAHLPAYEKAGFPVVGICDRDLPRAQALADRYGIGSVTGSVTDAVTDAPPDAVFDLALMPEHYPEALEALPDGAAVLLQKPIGNRWDAVVRVAEICRRKRLVAAVNTQLRFAPYVSVARAAIADGVIGELYDLEIQVEVNTPWEIFPSVLALDRLEINMHSIHYLDLVRSFVGDPASVSAVTVRHPEKAHANSRSGIVLHYPERPLRAIVTTNHDHHFGPRYEQSSIKWEGTKGAIRAQMGLLMAYPEGREDLLEIQLDADPRPTWRPLGFDGTWFPDAFIGSMGALLRYLEGSVPNLPTGLDDVLVTMAVVEAAYESSATGGVGLDRFTADVLP